MHILFYISIALEFGSVNHTSIYEKSESNVSENVKSVSKIFSNWPNDLFGTNVYKNPEFC